MATLENNDLNAKKQNTLNFEDFSSKSAIFLRKSQQIAKTFFYFIEGLASQVEQSKELNKILQIQEKSKEIKILPFKNIVILLDNIHSFLSKMIPKSKGSEELQTKKD